MLLRKGGTYAERAGAALGNLQRSASAMSILRARIEARINDGGEGTDLARVLQVVRDAEVLLKEMSAKAESARFLDDFVKIIGGASESIGQVTNDVSELVPMAEAALDQMRDAVSSVSAVLSSPAMKDEIEPGILEQVSAAIRPASEPVPAPTLDNSSSNQAAQEENEERIEVPA